MSTQLKVPVSPGDHVQGPTDAPITLVEYGDYECPYCGRAYPIVKRLQRHFEDAVRFVFRNFPLTQLHPHAEAAAETAEWAGTQDRFWEMHDSIYENQQRLSTPHLLSLATALRLNEKELAEALEQKRFEERIKKDFTGGLRSGVSGTPTFFINGQRHDGSFEFEELVAAVEQRLQQRAS